MSIGDFGKKLLIMSLIDNTMDTVGDFSSQKIRELIMEKTGVEVENEFIEDWLSGFSAITSMMATSIILAGTTTATNFLVDKVTFSSLKNVLFSLRNFATTVSSVAGSRSHISPDIIYGKAQGSLSEQKLAHYTYMNTAIQSRGAILHNGSQISQTLIGGVQAQSVMNENQKISIPQGQKIAVVMEELKNMARQGI